MAKWDNYITPTVKKCTGTCGLEMPVEKFRVHHKNKWRKNGDPSYCGMCIACEKQYYSIRNSKHDSNKLIKVVSLENEIWKSVVGFEGLYEISSLGRVKSVYALLVDNRGRERSWPERLLNDNISTKGYIKTTLSRNGKTYDLLRHRIVAQAFLPNPENLPEVNHKEGNSKDNRVEKLEWSTHQDNCIHRSKVLKRNNFKGAKNKCSKTIIVIYPNGSKKKIVGITEASRVLNIPLSSLRSALRGDSKTSRGLIFKYAA